RPIRSAPAGRPSAAAARRGRAAAARSSGTRCTDRAGRPALGSRSCPIIGPIIGWAGPLGLRYGPAMEDADGYFPERVAATYDDSADAMFDPAFTDTVAEVLAGR